MSTELLDGILARISGLSPKERAELVETALRGTGNKVWVPNTGPQTRALESLADELFYGGEAGGGKSDLIAGCSLTEHKRSLVLRRTNKEADKMVDRFAEIIGNRDGWNGQKQVWRFPDGRIIDIGGCQHEDDKQKYKGTPHDLICVGAGTPVLMADGTYRAIEDLRVGDFLQTLEGPRRLAKTFPVQHKEAVELAVCDSDGNIIGSQIQSTVHEVLMPSGWVCPGTPASDRVDQIGSPSTECRSSRKFDATSSYISWSFSRFRDRCIRILQSTLRLPQVALAKPHLQYRLEMNAYDQQVVRESGFVGFGGERLVSQRPLGSSILAKLLSQFLASLTLRDACSIRSRDACGAQKTSSLQGSMDRYSCDPRLCDERTHGSSGRCAGLEDGQLYLLQPDGAGLPSPNGFEDGGRGETHRHILHRLKSYDHPYRMERRRTEAFASIGSYRSVPVGIRPLYDIQVDDVNHYITQYGIVNKNCFDEVSDFSETQYTFISGWNRSTTEGQRCRVIAAGNPPTKPEGLWVIKRWAAWLDKTHPNPAKDGELRWYTTVGDDEVEFDGPGPHIVKGKEVTAKSRTFIRARLSDNPDLARTNYASTLDALPAALRAAYRDGDFGAALQDADWQVIPTAWILEAENRWKPEGYKASEMTAMALDPAGGGRDSAVIAMRYGGWYAELHSMKGEETADGSLTAAWVVSKRRHSCPIVVDVGGGYGGAVTMRLKDNSISCLPFNGASAGKGKTKDGQLVFANKRAEAWWRFREELDPDQEGGSVIALPPDAELRADLAAPSWHMSARGIVLESKDDIRERLGRSPGKGDAVVMAFSEGNRAIMKRFGSGPGQRQPKVNHGHDSARRHLRRS